MADKSTENTEQFIDLVRKYVFLYDLRHPDYKNVVKKAEAWKTIAEKQQQTSDAAKLKWKNLRDSYLKYLKFSKGGTGSAKKYKSWPWAPNLEFLQDTVAPRVTESNVPLSSESEVFEVAEDDCTTNESQMPPPPKNPMPPPPKKLKQKDVTTDVDKIVKYLENKKDNAKNSLDRTDHLFLSYSESFKRFSLRTQAVIKMEMAQMFGRAELRDLETNSSSNSSTGSSSVQTPPYHNENSSEVMNNTNQNYTNTSKQWYESFMEEF